MANWLHTVLVTVIFASCARISKQMECFEMTDPTWSVFGDLERYQSFKQTFNVQVDPTSNWVRIKRLPSPDLINEQFKTASSKYIIRLDLSSLGITSVSNGTFSNMTCMRTLDLMANRLTTIPAHALEDLVFLRTLNLTQNRIGHIDADMFGHLQYLHTLDLTLNLIHGVDDGAFARLPTLQFLNLTSNILVDLDFLEWGLPKSLMNLNVSTNSLQYVTASSNKTFEYLTRLDLSHNRLDFLDVPTLKSMAPNLVIVFVNDNQFPCAVLERLVEDFARFHFFYRTKKETFGHVDGIDCVGDFNDDLTRYDQAHHHKTADISRPQSSSLMPDAANRLNVDEVKKMIIGDNLRVMDAIRSLKSVIVMMFVLLLVLICVNVMFISGMMGKIWDWARPGRRCQQHQSIDNSMEAENFRLIQAHV